MKQTLKLYLFLILIHVGANAASHETELFSIEVPDELFVQNNKRGTATAVGKKIIDGMPSPYLMIQSCFNNPPAGNPVYNHCNTPCDESAKKLVSSNKLRGSKYSELKKENTNESTIRFYSELISPAPFSAFISISCSKQGQVIISFITDAQRDTARNQYNEIIGTLKWK